MAEVAAGSRLRLADSGLNPNGAYLSKLKGEIRAAVGASLLAINGIREQARSHQTEQVSATGPFLRLSGIT